MQTTLASDRRHPRAVRTEGQVLDGELAGVATVCEDMPPLNRIPHADRVVQAARGDARGIWAEGDAVDLAGVPFEALEKGARSRIPDPHDPVFAGGRQAAAVAVEGHPPDGPGCASTRWPPRAARCQ